MEQVKCDYAIVGAGAAGLQLALALNRDAFFSKKRIVIIEKDDKTINDRTWSYWEKGEGLWDNIAYEIWNKGKFKSNSLDKDLVLSPYSYKSIRGIDFYENAKKVLSDASNIKWIKDEIVEVKEEKDMVFLKGMNGLYSSGQAFDSRIDPSFYQEHDRNTGVIQHFLGWEIKTSTDVFDPDQFTMMDFTLKDGDSTSFMYILPTSTNKALVEFTYFSSELVEDAVYEKFIKKYIHDHLGADSYEVMSTEKGIIPMTDFPFHKFNSEKILKIGTAGGWVKPSTGYAFRSIEKKIEIVLNNLKKNRPVHLGLIKKRFRFYDSVFLNILQNSNHLGERIFSEMYGRNRTGEIFSFLDEETDLFREIRIISRFNSIPFLKALMRKLFKINN